MTGLEPAPAGTGERPEPHWLNLANAFTLLRVALVPVIAVLLARDERTARWWAFGVFVFAALTDSVDGWVARLVKGVTRWGKLMDPLADKALIVGALVILAWLGEVPWWAVAVIVVREVGVTAQRGWLLRRGVTMAASIYGKVKTVTQVVAVTLYLLPGVPGGARAVALGVAMLATVASGVEYAGRGRRLLRAAEEVAVGG